MTVIICFCASVILESIRFVLREVIPQTILIFPSKDVHALSVEDLFVESRGKDDTMVERGFYNEFPIKRAVFIDSTWQQTRSIYKDKRLRGIESLIFFFLWHVIAEI